MKSNDLKPRYEFDRDIMDKIQAFESDIPVDLEESLLEKLEEITPVKTPMRRRPIFYYGSLAAAAVILIAAWLTIYPLFNNRIETVEAVEVPVQDAFLENQPANIVVVNPSDPEMTIVWIERIDGNPD